MKATKSFIVSFGVTLATLTGVAADHGRVVAWGNNDYGQTNVPLNTQSGVIAIAAGFSHTVTLKTNGSVVAWGNNLSSQTNVPASAQSGVAAIAAGGYHTLALKTNGQVVAWGGNSYGQRTVPIEAQTGVMAIAAGYYNTAALKTNGQLVVWGDNSSGQTNVPASAQNGVTAIAAGEYCIAALKTNGAVVAWGDYYDEQTNVPLSAQSGVIAIAVGRWHNVALKTNGTVVAWGEDASGETTVPVAARSGVTAIAAGQGYTVALKTNGLVLAWGNNAYGKVNVPVAAQSGAMAIAGGAWHVAAITHSATVTLDGLSQVYDGTAKSITVTTIPPGLTFDLTYDGLINAPTNAGTYTVIATVDDMNYQGSATNTLVVSKASVTVTLGNLNQTYDGMAKSVTVSTAPLNFAVVLTYDGSTNAPTNAGNYTIIATVDEPNYQGGATNTLIVSKAAASVSLGNLNQTYNGDVRSVTVATTPPGLTVDLTYNGSANAPVNAGSYTVVGTIIDQNYQGSATDTLVVARAPVTVTLGSLSQTYDGTAKSATATTTPAGLMVNLTYNGSSSAPTNAGSYAVAGTVSDPNHQGSATNTLVVSKATVVVTLGNLNQTYDGKAKSVSASTAPDGLAVDLTYNGSAILPTNAGSYAVVGTVNDGNYAGSTNGTLLIAQASQTITFNPLPTKILGDTPFTLTASASSGLPVSYTSDNTAVAIVTDNNVTLVGGGSAVITASQEGNSNYLAAVPVAQTLTVYLTAIFDDFEPDIDSMQWSAFGGMVRATNYGGSVSGANSLWFGGSGSRLATTRPLNPSDGGVIRFSLRLANGSAYPWENVDLPGEGVVLEYSVNGATNWTNIATYDTAAFKNWSVQQATIPAGAQSTNTLFRWRQLSNSGETYDHWALDDVLIAVMPAPPAITAQPTNLTVAAGSNAIFRVIATGTPTPTYQWRFAGTNFADETASTLILTSITTNHAGTYSVVVSNDYGTIVSSNATLTVIEPLYIAIQPLSQTVGAGSNVTFSVLAFGAPPLVFQWYFKGAPVGLPDTGTNFSSYTLTNVGTNQAGTYNVQVVNPYGSVMSSNAVLTVKVFPPSIITQPASQRVNMGSEVSFNVLLNGTPPFAYRWRFKGTNILNATNAVYTIQAVAPSNTGNYSVVVTNSAGSATSSNALLTVIFPPILALQFSAGYPLLKLYGVLSSNFVVEYNTNLPDTNWMTLISLTNLSASPYQFLDPAGGGQPMRFYRAFMQ